LSQQIENYELQIDNCERNINRRLLKLTAMEYTPLCAVCEL